MAKKTEDRREAIAHKIKALRTENSDLSYEKFALKHGLDPRQYYRLENNEVNFKIDSLLRILDIHEISLGEFFAGL